jgi:hypothetical protein
MKTNYYGTPLAGKFEYEPKTLPRVEPTDDPLLLVAAHTPVRDFESTQEPVLTSETTSFAGLRIEEPAPKPRLPESYWLSLSREVGRALVGEEQRQKREVDKLFAEAQKTANVAWK